MTIVNCLSQSPYSHVRVTRKRSAHAVRMHQVAVSTGRDCLFHLLCGSMGFLVCHFNSLHGFPGNVTNFMSGMNSCHSTVLYLIILHILYISFLLIPFNFFPVLLSSSYHSCFECGISRIQILSPVIVTE
jgi:hypothetical protein